MARNSIRLSQQLVKLCYALENSRRYRELKGFFYDLLENPRAPVRPYFDVFMILLVLSSVSALIYEVRDDLGAAGDVFEALAVSIFIVEYLLRLWVYSDSHGVVLEHYERAMFLGVPFRLGPPLREIVRAKWDYVTSPLAIVDLLAIIPSYRPLRFLRVFLLFRLFKLFRYAHSISAFGKVLSEKRFELLTLGIFMAFVVLVSASALYFFEGDYAPSRINTFFDGIYWAVVTMSTVGYGDITPQTPEGRVVTMVLIIVGLGVISFFTSIIVSAFSEKLPEVRARRVFSEVEKRGRHTLLCGFGRVGQAVAQRLQQDKERFVVIDPDPDRVDLARKRGYLAVQGGGESNDLLIGANIARARRVMCLTGDDVINVYVTLTARQLNPTVEIISRANRKENAAKLRRSGATHTVTPFRMLSLLAAEFVGQPVAFEVVYGMFSSNEKIRIDAVRVHGGSLLEARRLGELDFAGYQLVLFGVIRRRVGVEPQQSSVYHVADKSFYFNPAPDMRLHANDFVVVFGHPYSITHFRENVENNRA